MLFARALRRPLTKQFLISTLLAATSLAAGGCGVQTSANDPALSLSKKEPKQAPAPVCSTDRFQQPSEPVSNKVDVLFVMDNSNSMNRHWQLMARQIGRLIHAMPANQDIRFGVVLGTITKYPGVLFSDPSVPKVLDGKKMSEQQIMAALTKTFTYAMKYENIDWKGAGEALFYSLYYAVTSHALPNQKLGFFRPDAALSVIFMSDDAEESYPYPSKQIWGLPPKCNWGHHETMRKTFYLPNKIDTDTTFAALKRLKGDMPVLTSAFVNITKQDILVDNSLNARCIYDSPGFGYFDIVKRTNGLLYSIHQDRGRGLELSGRLLASRVALLHDFKLSKPADKVDPATIEARVDAKRTPHTYSADTNVVHIDQAGGPGSLVEINHCEPVPQPEWTIAGFTGDVTQTTASLRWNTPEYPTTGKILYGTAPDALGFSVADSASSTSHAVGVTGLSPNTVYYFQAVALDEFGTERRSEVISLRTRPDWNMSPLAGQASRTSVSVSWTTPEYPTAGVVAWGLSPDQLVNVAPAASGTRHVVTIEGLTPDTPYFFQASSKDEFGLVKTSPILALRTSTDWAIVGFTGQALRNAASLMWQTPDEVTTGQLRYGLAPDQLVNVVNDGITGSEHGVSLSGLSPGTTYYFQAAARSGTDGREKVSPVISLTTLKDWTIAGFGALSTETTVTVSFTTADYLTDGVVLWGRSADQLSNTVDADAAAFEHSAGIAGLQPDSTYFVQAVARDNLGVERRTPVTAVRTKPAPLPTWSIAGFDGSTDTSSATLTWLTSEYPTAGKVLYGTSPDNLGKSVAETTSAKTHEITVGGLEPDTFYYFQVVASDDKGQTQNSSVIGLRTQALPLPAWDIADLSSSSTQTSLAITFATAGYPTKGYLRWGLSAGNLDRQTIADGTAVKEHTFTIDNLNPDTTYFVQAVAADDRGQTKSSNVMAFRTAPIPLPSWAITDVSANPSQNGAVISWSTAAYDTKGLVRWGQNSANLENQTSAELNPGRNHSFTLTGLEPDTTYFFQVVSADDRGQTKAGDVTPFRTLPLPLPSWAIMDFRGTPSQTTANLTFTTADYATTGFVRWGTSAGNLGQQTSVETLPLNAHAFTVSGLAPDTTYYFQAVASDDRGQTKTSEVISLRTLPLAPPVWNITDFAGTPSVHSVTLNWNTNDYATTGRVRWGFSANQLVNATPWEAGVWKAHSITVTGLDAGTTYYFQAESTDDRGQVKTSPVIAVKTSVVPPSWVISGFDGTTSSTAASLIWQTGVPTKGTLKVGLNAADLTFRTVELTDFTATHMVSVTGLQPNTTYFFQVVATDVDGGVVTSGVISKKTKAR